VKRGGEDQVSTAGLVDEILQTGAVQAQVKSVGAGHVEAWAFGASGKDSNRETRGLGGGSLRGLFGSRLVGGHHNLFREHLLEGVMKAACPRCVERTEIEVHGLNSFDAEGSQEPLGKAAGSWEHKRKANQKSGQGSGPGRTPTGGEYAGK
jgi:hypothetical protein